MKNIEVVDVQHQLEERLHVLREKLEGDLDEIETARLRGRIREVRLMKQFIAEFGKTEAPKLTPVEYV